MSKQSRPGHRPLLVVLPTVSDFDSNQLKSGARNGSPGSAYGYVITDTYPHVMARFTGKPDASFQKRRG